MILSSADILRVLGGSEVVRLSAKLKIVDGKPALSGAEGLFVYIDRFPRIDEFQATWTIYIESDGSEPDDLVLAEIKKLLPSVQVQSGLMTTVTTTDFLSANTQRAPEPPKVVQAQVDLSQYEERFQSLVEDVQDQMLLVGSGRPGKDGRDGRDGVDGRDGKDVDGTQLRLFQLADVEGGIPLDKGQVLTWNGSEWTNLFVPQLLSAVTGGSGGGDGGGTGSVDNVTIISETAPTTRDDGSDLIQGDGWYVQSTDQLYLYIDGAWEEIKVDEGASGGVASGFWKFKDNETEGYADGRFRVNSHQNKTDWSLATELYVGYKTNGGANVKNVLLNLVKPDQYVYIQRKDRPDAWVILLVEAVPVDADEKGCRIAVSFVNQGTAVSDIKNDKLCDISFVVVSGGGGSGGGIEEAPINGEAYVRQNAAWTPLTSANVDISANQLGELSDVNVPTPSAGEALLYNGSQWVAGGDLAGGSF